MSNTPVCKINFDGLVQDCDLQYISNGDTTVLC